MTGCAKKKKMAQMTEHFKAPEIIQLSSEQIANQCTIQNTGNQEAYRIGWIWSQIRWKNEGYAKRNKGKCTGNQ